MSSHSQTVGSGGGSNVNPMPQVSKSSGGGGGGDHHNPMVGVPDANGFIYDPRDADVLCGRGGAALRHPGNQTYRRLVSLNKGLYVTCLKTEKLKISRSIVAAIREQNGRFLEKDNDRNAWFDIGEKKAVEKTSQALREGAPKLRQKIAELHVPAGVHQHHHHPPQVDIDPFDHLSSYQHQDLLTQQQTEQEQQFIRAEQMLRRHSSLGSSSNHSATSAATTTTTIGRTPQHDIQPIPPNSSPINGMRTTSTNSRTNPLLPVGGIPMNGTIAAGGNSRHRELQMDMLHRLSLHNEMQQKLAAVTQQQHRRSSGGLLNSRVSLARELGISESQLSLMSEFSTISSSISGRGSTLTFAPMGDTGRSSGNALAAAAMAGDLDYASSSLLFQPPNSYLFNATASYHQAPQPANFSFRNMTSANLAAEAAAAVNSSDMDRRRVFAKMKYSRPPSVRSIKGMGPQLQQQGVSQQSMDDLPDFNMVESNLSLFSLSSKMSTLDMKPAASVTYEPNQANAHLPHNAFGNHQPHHQQQQQHDLGYGAAATQPFLQKVIVESALSNRSDFLTVGSRHSIMSGLSKISDSSIDNSIFSDLSRKIGNVSTRSVAMSEMSIMEMQDMMEDLGDPRSSEATHGIMPPPGDRQQPPVHSSSQQRKLMTTATSSSMDFDMLR